MTRKLRIFLLFCMATLAIVVGPIIGPMKTARAADQPDLIVTAVSWSPSQPFAGDMVRFSAVITNQGTASTPAGTVIGGIFKVDGNNVTYTDSYTTSLAPGQSATLTANGGGSLGDGTWTAQEGTHTIAFQVDDINRIAESDETNNTFTGSETLGIQQREGPDLVISNLTWQPQTLQVGNATTFSAVVTNHGQDPALGGVVVQFKLNDQSFTSGTSTAELASGSSVTITGQQTWNVANGAHIVEAIADPDNTVTEALENNNARAIQLAVGQQVTETAKSADSFVDSIGVNTHLSYYDTPYGDYNGIVLPRLQESGIRYIRDAAFLPQTDITNKFKNLAAVGIKTNLLAAETTPERVLQVVKQASPAVISVEGPNEPDAFTPAQFPDGTRAYQNGVYALIKGDPATQHIPVIAPSPVREGSDHALGPVSCDFGNAHPYSGGLLPDRSMDQGFVSADVVCPDKPVMVTEVGYNNAIYNTFGQPGISETAGAKYTARTYLETFRRGAVRTFLYEFIDEFSDPDFQNPEARFGIVRNDGTPKPAFHAIKNMISLLKEPGANFTPGTLSYTLNGDVTNLQHMLLQKQDGTYYMVLWVNAFSYDVSSKQDTNVPAQSVTVTFDQSFGSGLTYQPVQSVNPTGTYSNPSSITLNVPDEPLIVELKPEPGGILPFPWKLKDIGSVGVKGASSFNNGTFTVAGSGSDIWGTNDEFHFDYQSLNGDGSITARIANLQKTDQWAKAGLMIRESLDANSKNAFVALTPKNGSLFQWRSDTGASSQHQGGPPVKTPSWLRLTRAGDTFTAFVSNDGLSWTAIGTQTISMASTVSIGLAVTAHNNSKLNTANFETVSVLV